MVKRFTSKNTNIADSLFERGGARLISAKTLTQVNSMNTQLPASLREIVGGHNVLCGEALQLRNNGFWDSSSPEALAIAMPETTAQICEILALCHQLRQPVVIHGGLTGLTGAQRTSKQDLVISLEHMHRITAFDGDGKTLTAEAGCTLQQVQEYAAARGMLFSLDIGARSACTIGGNISTNAGGMEVIRYGMMREQVLGLEAVLPDGTLLSSLNQMQKNNAGFDLKQLFIGSEGTLGIVTKAVLRLHPAPATRETVLASCQSFRNVVQLLNRARADLAGTLTRFELMDGDYFRTQTAPGNHPPPMARDYNWYVLLEACGSDPRQDQERLENWLAQMLACSTVADAVLARNQQQREALWQIREVFEAVIREKPNFLYDVSLPIGEMESYILQLRQEISKLWSNSHFYSMGHLGDGNLHFFVSPRQEEDYQTLKDTCDRIIYSPLAKLGGSVSAEHGIGIDKKPWLSASRTTVEIDLMRRLKLLFDPHNILNPRRVVDV